MGTIQNIMDRFWITVGKTEKVYPVQVEKYRVQGENIVFDSMDAGRTLVDDEGNKTFELKNEPYAEGMVSYQDFEETMDGGNRVALVMIDRDKFVPLRKNFDFSQETYLDEEEQEMFEVDENALEYTLGVSTFLEWAEKDWQESSRIVETENAKWWQQEKFQAAILFVSAGLFFIFVGFAAGETYLKDIAQEMSSLEQALKTAGSTLGGGS